jgi:hypothetical protein
VEVVEVAELVMIIGLEEEVQEDIEIHFNRTIRWWWK